MHACIFVKPQKSLKSCLKSLDFDLTLQFITCFTIQSFYNKNDKLIKLPTSCVVFPHLLFQLSKLRNYLSLFLIGNTKHQLWKYELAYIYTYTLVRVRILTYFCLWFTNTGPNVVVGLLAVCLPRCCAREMKA